MPALRGAATLALLCASGATAAGCGGQDASASGEDGVRGALRQYASAVSDGDAGAVCDVLARASREALARAAGGSCSDAVATLVNDAGDVRVDVGAVAVRGDVADARFTQTAGGRGAEQSVQLRREDGSWRIVQPGLGS